MVVWRSGRIRASDRCSKAEFCSGCYAPTRLRPYGRSGAARPRSATTAYGDSAAGPAMRWPHWMQTSSVSPSQSSPIMSPWQRGQDLSCIIVCLLGPAHGFYAERQLDLVSTHNAARFQGLVPAHPEVVPADRSFGGEGDPVVTPRVFDAALVLAMEYRLARDVANREVAGQAEAS